MYSLGMKFMQVFKIKARIVPRWLDKVSDRETLTFTSLLSIDRRAHPCCESHSCKLCGRISGPPTSFGVPDTHRHSIFSSQSSGTRRSPTYRLLSDMSWTRGICQQTCKGGLLGRYGLKLSTFRRVQLFKRKHSLCTESFIQGTFKMQATVQGCL